MKWFINLKIAHKLIIGFLVVALIAAIVGVVGMLNIMAISKQDKLLYKEDTLGLQYAGETAVNFQQLRYFILKTLTLDSQKEIEDNNKNVTEFFDKTKTSFEQYKKEIQIRDSEVQQHVDDITSLLAEYEKDISIQIGYLNSGDQAKSDDFIVKTMAPVGNTLRDNFLDLMTHVSQLASEKAEVNTGVAQRGIIIMLVIVIAAVVIAVVLGMTIAKAIGNPLSRMATIGNMLAVGDIHVEKVMTKSDYELRSQKDEVGTLAQSFHELITSTVSQVEAIKKLSNGDLTIDLQPRSENDALNIALKQLIDNLNNLVGTIVTAADQVTSGASMVSNSSMALSQGATEQASAVQQLTASLNEVALKTQNNAQSAQKASELANEAKLNAVDGNTQMKGMLLAMDDINESSSSINKIIKVIDDIAFQTNILALNAAVEAARAGQHGRGFAVVAEEVRSLAAKSAQAAKETTTLIENSIKKVETGSKIAISTADALEKIMQRVEKAAVLVYSISSVSEEQSSSIGQINEGVSQVSQVVQTNAATAEESAAASEELSAQAQQMMQTVGIFKTKNNVQAARHIAESTVRPSTARKTISIGSIKDTGFTGDFGKY